MSKAGFYLGIALAIVLNVIIIDAITPGAYAENVNCPKALYPCGLPTPAGGGPTPSPVPTDAAGVPLSHPSCPPGSYPCGLPTPQPFQTAASGNQGIATCDGTTATTCGKVTNASGANQSAAFAPFVQAFGYFWNGTAWQVMPMVSPAPYPAHSSVKVGNSSDIFLDSYPEGVTITATINSATTTLLFAGVANQNMYIWFAAFVTNGTNASNTVQLVRGQTVSTPCDTNQTPINAVAYAPPTSSGGMSVLYGGFQQAAATLTNAIIPASTPMISVANATPFNVCIKTTGTTTAGVGVILAVNHAN